MKINFDQLSPTDFDGHTEFATLTPEQKLNWLASIAELASAPAVTAE